MAELEWTLVDFSARLREWVAAENPPDFQWKAAARWVLDLPADPRASGRREDGFDDLWFAEIPDTLDVRSRVVVCSMWIDHAARTVRCECFTTLSWPV